MGRIIGRFEIHASVFKGKMTLFIYTQFTHLRYKLTHRVIHKINHLAQLSTTLTIATASQPFDLGVKH